MEKLFYYAQLIDGAHILCTVLLALSSFAFLVTFIATMVNVREHDAVEFSESTRLGAIASYRAFRKWAYRTFALAIFCALFVIFVPSKKTFLFMIGGSAVDKVVANNPEVKEIPGNTLELLNEYIKAETVKLREGSKPTDAKE